MVVCAVIFAVNVGAFGSHLGAFLTNTEYFKFWFLSLGRTVLRIVRNVNPQTQAQTLTLIGRRWSRGVASYILRNHRFALPGRYAT